MKLKKTILLSTVALVTIGLITTACSNHGSSKKDAASSKVENSTKKDKSESKESSSKKESYTPAQKSEAKEAQSTNEAVQGKGSDTVGKHNTVAKNSDQLDNAMMQEITNDLIKRHGYPKNTTPGNFIYMTSKTADGEKIDVRENDKGSQTASLVGQYMIKGNTLYYQDLASGTLVKVN